MPIINMDCMHALTQTMVQVREGSVTGVICIRFNGEDYDIIITGSALTRPVLTLGAMTLAKRQVEESIVNDHGLSLKGLPRQRF
jgi:hypothetical protein